MARTNRNDNPRNFRFIVYPESWDDDWELKLEEYQIPTWMSPAHDPDPVAEDPVAADPVVAGSDPDRQAQDKTNLGETDSIKQQRKVHHHMIMHFSGKKNPEVVKQIIHEIWGAGACIPPDRIFHCHDLEGAVRYLIHADNPEKQQFAGSHTIRVWFGADRDLYFQKQVDREKICREITQWIEANEVRYFASAVKFAAETNPDWYQILTQKSTFFFVNYCKSIAKIKKDDSEELDCIQDLIDAYKNNIELVMDDDMREIVRARMKYEREHKDSKW